jgi:hypothetical protein
LLAYSLVISIILIKCSFLIYEKEERNGSLRGAFGGGRALAACAIGASEPAYGAYTDNI